MIERSHCIIFFFFKQKTAYEMRISDWSSDVCSSDLPNNTIQHGGVMLGIGGVAGHAYTGAPRGYPGHKHRAGLAQTLSAVTAACVVMRASVYHEVGGLDEGLRVAFRSEEHTSELQSLMRISYAVFCLKKKTNNQKK